MSTPERLINGIPESQYGSWCPHGKRIMVANPVAVDPDCPGLVFVVPWPCDAPECSREEIERQIEEEEDRYEAERWAEYYDMVAEGLFIHNPAPSYYEDDY